MSRDQRDQRDERPDVLPYREDKPIPYGYRLEERSRKGLIISGAIVLGVPYLIGLSVISTNGSNNGANWLAVPALGPWLAIGARRRSCPSPSSSSSSNSDTDLGCAADALATVGLVFDGIVQTAGAVLLIVGLTVPKKVLVKQDVATLTFAPVGSGYGVAALGTF